MRELVVDWCLTHGQGHYQCGGSQTDCRLVRLSGEFSDWDDEEERERWWDRQRNGECEDATREIPIVQDVRVVLKVTVAPWCKDPDGTILLLSKQLAEATQRGLSNIDHGFGDECAIEVTASTRL